MPKQHELKMVAEGTVLAGARDKWGNDFDIEIPLYVDEQQGRFYIDTEDGWLELPADSLEW